MQRARRLPYDQPVSVDHSALAERLTAVLSANDWPRLSTVFAPDAVMEYPQSGEAFRGLDHIRAQFEEYPGTSQVTVDAIAVAANEPTYVLSPSYTVISVGGSGKAATATLRARYPDGSLWWVVVVYETAGERISQAKVYFAADFEPAEWRAPYNDAAR